jgi:hypothetical protein
VKLVEPYVNTLLQTLCSAMFKAKNLDREMIYSYKIAACAPQ